MSAAAHARSGWVALRRACASATGLVLLAALPLAQQREPYVEHPDRPESDEGAALAHHDDPGHAFELFLGGDGLGLGYRNAFHRGDGYGTLGFFVNEDDDLALLGRFLRFGEPSAETPLALGIGLGVFGATVDESDSELAAITLTGAIEYGLELAYPVRIGLEASYAPDAASFLDGKRVLDLQGRVEADLSTWATAFVGYRHLEVDIEDEDDAELDHALHVGVRLGF